ncbi:MAG: hypothetical protein COA99_11080 [Moraxellaceae bacterium]|nr:MAG: hypothetical protein COA99_11080 [Moraxellaceae bacterium]
MTNPAVWDSMIHKNKPAPWLVYFLLSLSFYSISFVITPLASALGNQSPANTTPTTPTTSKIAIIIDDIGYNRPAGEFIIKVPGALTYAVIPFTPFGKKLAELAHAKNKEVLLHLPMEATVHKKLDAGGLTINQSKYELKDLVNNSLSAVPHVTGFNNHMGSLLTTDRKAMEWIMEEASSKGIFFIDSFTNANSIAGKVASEHEIPNLRRDIFLDNNPSKSEIHKAFQLLLAKAKKNGYAIGIAHPHPATIKYLAENITKLADENIELVSVSTLVNAHWKPTEQPSKYRLAHKIASLPTPPHTRFRFVR